MKLTAAEARARFAASPVARLATADAHGVPHVVPITFALDGDRLQNPGSPSSPTTTPPTGPPCGGPARTAGPRSTRPAPSGRARSSCCAARTPVPRPPARRAGGHGPGGDLERMGVRRNAFVTRPREALNEVAGAAAGRVMMGP
ncbi:pyridoxamine 5'-phosphate oxidase family protein [Streptomyces sp. M19]